MLNLVFETTMEIENYTGMHVVVMCIGMFRMTSLVVGDVYFCM